MLLNSQPKLDGESCLFAKISLIRYNRFKLTKGETMSSEPKKHSSPRKTGLRRSHLRLKLARQVNGKSPVKVTTTKRETGSKVK